MGASGETIVRVTGDLLIGDADVRGTAGEVHVESPAPRTAVEPAFGSATAADVDRACRLAVDAADPYARTTRGERASLLEAMAESLVTFGEALVERLVAETGLTRHAADRELSRGIMGLRSYAAHLNAPRAIAASTGTLGTTSFTRTLPVGPAAIACDGVFPFLALTASAHLAAALAAGCPVIVRSHPSCLGTCELQGRAIRSAIHRAGLPEGIFSLLVGSDVADRLGDHPSIRAIVAGAATGRAGRAWAGGHGPPLVVVPERLPSSPIFVLPDALNARAESLGRRFVARLTADLASASLRSGLIVAAFGDGFVELREALGGAMSNLSVAPLFARFEAADGVVDAPAAAQAALLETSADQLLTTAGATGTLTGPAVVLVRCASEDELLAVTAAFGRPSSVTLCLTDRDIELARRLLAKLEPWTSHIVLDWTSARSITGAIGGPSEWVGLVERFSRRVRYDGGAEALLPPTF